MEYYYSSNFNGSGTRVAISRFHSGNDAHEIHVMITLPHDATETPASQFDRISRAAEGLVSEFRNKGVRPVMARWFLSDSANLTHMIPKLSTEPIAVSVIGQAPINCTYVALWIYFMSASEVEPISEFSVMASRNGRRHIFTASVAIAGFNSHAATSSLLKNYNLLLIGRNTSLASGCIRTWFFVRDIDYFYKGMVRGRNEVFAEVGLTADTHFIASTGIEGNPGDPDVTVRMDAWAVGGLNDKQISYITAPTHLNATHEYGVAFERATAIDYADRRHLIISGTASIDSDGQIVCPGDIYGQTKRMIENVTALLHNGKARWTDVAYIIIYLRDIADRNAVEQIMEQRFPEMCSAPRIMVEAPVCRPGWLIEMECMAIAPASCPEYASF